MWEQRLHAWQASGQSAQAWCREHGVSPKTFGYWCRRLSTSPAVVPVLVQSTVYDAAGRAWTVTDPKGIEARTTYDLLGRVVKTVENYVDGTVSDAERQAVRAVLMDRYGLDESEVDRLVADATRRDAEAVDFYRFTSAITSLPEDDRIEIIRMMWQVVYADRQNHELEDNMVWRVAELIGVSARQRTILRSQMAHPPARDA